MADLWQVDARAGRRDCAPGATALHALGARFDWEAKCRVTEDSHGRLTGAVLLTSRATPMGVLAIMDVAGGNEVVSDLVRWAMGLSRAAGAVVAQLFVGRGHGEGLLELGFQNVRPWWRMDRSLTDTLPAVGHVAGYELIDPRAVRPGTWADMHNRSFADHWRFAPRAEAEIMNGKLPELCLLAVTAAGREPAAVTIGLVETYTDDPRPQPVGLVSSVGTVPEHRRRGLATWLVAEILPRLRSAGASHASLYVDGWNDTRAATAYAKLGFGVAFEAEVWEAPLR